MEQKVQPQLQQARENQIGFSYAFTKALLQKLRELKVNDTLFKEGGICGSYLSGGISSSGYRELSLVGAAVCSHLSMQLFGADCYKANSGVWDEDGRPCIAKDGPDNLIKTTEEFLALFEECPAQ